MTKTLWLLCLLTGIATCSFAAPVLPTAGWWRASLQRQDGHSIDFNVSIQYKNGKPVWYIRNATEKIEVTTFTQKQDSLLVQMPLFESEFRLVQENKTTLRGLWIKGGAMATQVMPVVFVYNQSKRYPLANNKPGHIITGRWAAVFANKNSANEDAIVEFKQSGANLTGTVLTPTGDYRYLEGVVNNDTLQLSTFDGSHAYYFRATIQNDSIIKEGAFISGAVFNQKWTANKNANATLPDTLASVYLKPGEDQLHFRFLDIDSNYVSNDEPRFRDKVIVIQLMGSWCPNCMDETAFLSDYYNHKKPAGVEMIALAYEYSTDFHRSQKGLRKFQQHFNMQYPVLITGVRVGDSLRTEKTLPQLTRIKMFPTTVFIGRDGKVKKIHTGFMGPGTGEHYEAYKKEFYATIEELLK